MRIVPALVIVLAAAHAAAARTSVAPRNRHANYGLQAKPTTCLARRGATLIRRARLGSVEYATPLERPARFDGRRLEDITPAEMAQIRQAAEQQAIDGLAPDRAGPITGGSRT